jgi:predicted small secreted protein
MKKMTTLIALCFGFAAAALLAGCNTMHGFGQDVQKAGTAIENAAKK